MSQRTRYLLDTNILVHYIRQDAFWARLRERFNLLAADPTPLISIVSSGELRSLAIANRWGATKLDRVEYALGYFDVVPVDGNEMVRVYAQIDAGLRARRIKMGKNDLWIAATGTVSGAYLLTMDTDFLPLFGTGLHGEWIDPDAT